MSTTFPRATLRTPATLGALRGWERFDVLLVLPAIGLVLIGFVLIYSGSSALYAGPAASINNPVARQFIFAGVGFCAMLVAARFDYHHLTHYWWLLYAISIVSLVAVLFIGDTAFGSTRWFDLGIVQVQPSEFAKLAVIVATARFFQDRGGDAKDIQSLLISLAIVAPVAGLVFIEPDLGTTIVFGAIWLGMVTVAGVSRNHLIVLGAMFVAILPFVWAFAVADYQVERISVLIDPYEDQDGRGAGYNNIQSALAIGSGGFSGKGLRNGDQTQLEYLKVPTKDFVFSVLAEEFGFIGAMVLFALFVVLLLRAIRIAGLAGDPAGQLMAVGIVLLILMQAFINLAVNLSLFPVTGIPLPFVSQGGSSLVSLFVSLGILQSILMRHRAYRQA
jgi:rod shape determining protein RodA